MDASTAQEMSPFIGRLAMLVTGELTISVQILDVRHVWQRTDFKVTPVFGSGEQWVSTERVTLVKAEPAFKPVLQPTRKVRP
jgi:hypothetical protein